MQPGDLRIMTQYLSSAVRQDDTLLLLCRFDPVDADIAYWYVLCRSKKVVMNQFQLENFSDPVSELS